VPSRFQPADVFDVHRRLADARTQLSQGDAALVERQITVAEIASPTGDEGDRASWLAARFERAGLENIDIDGAGNVIGRRRGRSDQQTVAVCAHIDTVFPRATPHAILRTGHRLVGPSITDNSRGVASMLSLAALVDGVSLATRRPIEFVGTTGEEGSGDLRGAKHYFATRGADSCAALIIDGAGDERIVHRALGSRRFRAEFHGPGGHSWIAFGAPNAVHAATTAAAAVARLPLPREPRTTVTVARIGGGMSINSIPANAWFEIDVRSSSAEVIGALAARITEIVQRAAMEENQRSTPGTAPLRGGVSVIGDRPCGELPPDDPIVECAVQATSLIGRVPELAMASTDANVPIGLGIPAVAIGMGGRGGDVHTESEWYENVDGSLGVARALTILVALSA
jgi:acetylornithine deacetylase/succinyl-diaminopimelate desuccinylase-like protein